MEKVIKKLLITRFSALGDVAMTVPVISSFATSYPDIEIVVMSRPFMKPFFEYLPKNVNFIGVDLKKDYVGFSGLWKLAKEIKSMNFDAFADFHDVLRTKILRKILFFSKIKIATIDKGRSEKRKLCKLGANKFHQVKTSFERYADVLRKLGFRLDVKFHSIFDNSDLVLSDKVKSILPEKKSNVKYVGIAPFAALKGKIYPLDKIAQVIKNLTDRGAKVFLFGAGDKEKNVLDEFESKYENVVSTAGKLGGIANELQLISLLDVMICMDSSNMHFASLVGTRVISVWGATHPAAGFLGFNQKIEDAVQLPLDCRPCSIYGKKPCKYGDYRCLQIEPSVISDAVFS